MRRRRWMQGMGTEFLLAYSEESLGGYDVSLVGLLLAPPIVWVALDTSRRSDSSHTAKTRFAGADRSPGVLHLMARTGEGIGDGASLHTLCVPGA